MKKQERTILKFLNNFYERYLVVLKSKVGSFHEDPPGYELQEIATIKLLILKQGRLRMQIPWRARVLP